jgi:hypothetical protein
VRSNVASHRTGPKVEATLARAQISRYDLQGGYVGMEHEDDGSAARSG